MADISKIQLIDGVYDVKDETAREHITQNEIDIAQNSENISLLNCLNPYYDEITYKYGRANDTNYYLITIPYEDSEGNEIPFELIKAETNTSPLDNAKINNSNFLSNGSLAINNGTTFIDGVVIIDGVVVNDTDVSEYCTTEKYMGIKENREIVIFDNNTTAETMLNAGVKYACMIFGQCVINGVIDTEFEFQRIKGPDIFIGQKPNKDLVIISSDGRNSHNKGMDYTQMSQILIANGCINVYSLDGGGSTSTIYKGNKLNMNVDDGGVKDRKISYLFNVTKKPIINRLNDVYNFVGEMKHLLNYQLRPLINNCEMYHHPERLRIGSAFTPSTSNVLPLTLSAPSSPAYIRLTTDENGGTHINLPSGEGLVIMGMSVVVQPSNSGSVYVKSNINNATILNLGETIGANEVRTISGTDYFYVNEETNDLTITIEGATALRGIIWVDWKPLNNTTYNG